MAPVRTSFLTRLAAVSPARAAAWIGAAWGGASLFLWYRLGVRLGGDSHRYFDAARALLEHQPLPGKSASYLGYDLFVAAHLAAGGGPASIVCAQALASLAAAWCLYRLGEALFGSAEGLLAAIAFSTYPALRQWDFYVLTDSLFVSAAVVMTWSLVCGRGVSGRLAGTALVLFTTSVRPNGVIVPVAAGLWAARRLWLGGWRRSVLAGAALAAVLAWPALHLVGRMVGHEHVLDQLASGAIVHGFRDTALAVPPDLVIPAAGGNPLARIVEFALVNPGYFLALAGAKLGYFLLRVRPYYSGAHNLFLLVTLVPAYLLAAAGAILRRPRVAGGRTLILGLCGLQAVVVALTFADWDSRHSLLILPFAFLFAAAGLLRLAGPATPAVP